MGLKSHKPATKYEISDTGFCSRKKKGQRMKGITTFLPCPLYPWFSSTLMASK
jgi:hypothetical protein